MNSQSKHISAGITFHEVSPGTMLRLNAEFPYYLIFLLKGDLEVKNPDSAICIAENEFFIINNKQQANCAAIGSSRFVVVDWNWNEDIEASCFLPEGGGLIQAFPIHNELLVLFNYLMATMPFNEKLEHHSIQRVIRVMMRKYYATYS